jgi:hypothetical protein
MGFLAEHIASKHPDLFPSGASPSRTPPSSSSSRALHQARLAAISLTLLDSRTRLRNDPVEWVYDGLGPLLLPEVLRRRKGVPLMLAITYCG